MSIEQLNTRFRLVRGSGYDPEEVEAEIARLEAQNEALVTNVSALEEQIQTLETAADPARAGVANGPDPRDVGEALVLAQEFARGLRAKAQEEADHIVAAAQTAAEQIRADAEATRDRLQAVEADYVRRIQALQEKGRGYAEDLRATLSLFEEHLNTLPVPPVVPSSETPAAPLAEAATPRIETPAPDPASGSMSDPPDAPLAWDGSTPETAGAEALPAPSAAGDLAWEEPAAARLVLSDEDERSTPRAEPDLPLPAWNGGGR